MNYVILALLWIGFCVFHSGMISLTVTVFLRNKTGSWYRFYRLFYNLFSFATLVPVVIYSYSVMEVPFFSWTGYFIPVRYLLLAAGIWLLITGAKHYNMSSFLGFTQIKEGVRHGLINISGQLDSGGILGMIRHPFYTASFLLIWTGNLDHTRLIINIILSIYLIIGTYLEERKLVLEFGDEYRNYQRNVSMFIPWKWLIVKFRDLRRVH